MAINTTSVYEQQKFILQCLHARPHSTNNYGSWGFTSHLHELRNLEIKAFILILFTAKKATALAYLTALACMYFTRIETL